MNRLKSILFGLYRTTGASSLHERLFGNGGCCPVLLFHRVTDEVPWDGITVSTEYFRRFCRLMRDRFRVLPLEEVVAHAATGQPFPRRTVAITFDDCYRDNLAAAEVLAEHGLPATFFLPTGFVGTTLSFPWDADLPKLANLGWEEARRIADLGHGIGSHSVDHPDMGRLNADEVSRQLIESRRTLEERLECPVRYFAYPFGGKNHCDARHLPLVHEAGYEACFSAHGGFVGPGMRKVILPREAVPPFPSLAHLELFLTGSLDWVYSLKKKVGMF